MSQNNLVNSSFDGLQIGDIFLFQKKPVQVQLVLLVKGGIVMVMRQKTLANVVPAGRAVVGASVSRADISSSPESN